jgi:hypothetical protein
MEIKISEMKPIGSFFYSDQPEYELKVFSCKVNGFEMTVSLDHEIVDLDSKYCIFSSERSKDLKLIIRGYLTEE